VKRLSFNKEVIAVILAGLTRSGAAWAFELSGDLRPDNIRARLLDGLAFIKTIPAIDGDCINLTWPKVVDFRDYQLSREVVPAD